MAAIAADRNLLFGLLALQNGLIDQGQLVAAFQAWTLDKARALADHLVARGDLDADDRSAVDALVARHIKKHGGDAEKSLAAIPAGRTTRASLAHIADPDIEVSLGHVGAPSTQHDPDADIDRTASYSVGAATSSGQRFRVLRPHARGGLGAVFVALDTELHREVALKQILDQHAADAVSRGRFLLEAEVTGGLEHPGIVPVYGLGTYGDGRPYYAMRFIRGDSLKEAIAQFHADEELKRDTGRRSLELRKLLRRFLDVCNAIDYAHSRGVLHRDIKPGNIIVGKHGETLVVDWGLAKARGRSDAAGSFDERPLVPGSASGSAETLPGSALGTPAYMSPEQAQGDLEHLGPHSDVYSLGATLYCLLSGKPPVEGDDVGDMLRAVQKGEFPSPRQFDPTIDQALEAVCLKAMARKSEDRYASPRALAEDVERWMADEPVNAWREPFSRRARRWARRHRTGVTASAAVLLMALAGTAAVSAVQTRANSQLKTANAALAAANAREAARFNLAIDAIKLFHGEVSEDLLLKEKQFDRLRSRLLRGAADFYGKLEELLKGQADRRSRSALGKAYHELGELTDQIGSKTEALVVHHKALAVRRDLAADPTANAETKADVARSLLAVGTLLQQTGRLDEAVQVFERARSLSMGLAELNPRSDSIRGVLAYCFYRIGWALYLRRESTEALTAYERAQTIFQKLTEANPTNIDYLRGLSWCYNDIGIELEAIGRLNDALTAYERSVAVKQRVADANPDVAEFRRDLALSHMNIGFLLMVSGKPSEALVVHEQARAIQEKLAEANPNVTRILVQLAKNLERIGSLLLQTGKPAEALVTHEKSLAIRQRLAETNPSVTDLQLDLAQSLARVGRLKQQAGRAAEAAALFEQFRQTIAVLEQLPTLYPVDLYNLACSHAILAGVAGEPGSSMTTAERQAEADRAIQWLRRAIAAGYRKLALIQTDPDLDPLRSRPDFPLLMLDLAFPADPFARGD